MVAKFQISPNVKMFLYVKNRNQIVPFQLEPVQLVPTQLVPWKRVSTEEKENDTQVPVRYGNTGCVVFKWRYKI